jgi:hypothetical protein
MNVVKLCNHHFLKSMIPEEKNLISGLFDRLGEASNQPKDLEADQLIRSKVAENPAAPYLLAQSILVMQQAISNAQTRIAALEKQVAEGAAATQPHQGGGSFLSGVASLFGGGQPQRATPTAPPAPPIIPLQQQAPPPQSQPYGYPPPVPPPQQQQQPSRFSGSGGFLQGALTTAAGVAGGTLLVQGIENLIGHNPGPFSGAFAPSGGSFGGDRPVENTEVINNYYNEGDQSRDQYDPKSGDQNVSTDYDPNLDPNSDPGLTTADYSPDDTDLGGDDLGGGGDDSSYV